MTKLPLWMVAAAMLVATGMGASAQAPSPTDDATKLLRCRQDTRDLIFLNREQLRARCGLWTKAYTVKTSEGEVERIVYSRYFVVTVRNGQVTHVRQRRQIFTGFRKKSD